MSKWGPLILVLVACGGGETEPTVECDIITFDDDTSDRCRILTEGLYLEPDTQCPRVWDGTMADVGTCIAIGDGNVTINRSQVLNGKRGLVVELMPEPSRLDEESGTTCVFRECQ